MYERCIHFPKARKLLTILFLLTRIILLFATNLCYQGSITAEIPQIFDAVFECTLEMINKDFEEFPEHRTNFFLLLQAVNNHCFPALLKISAVQFKLVLNSIVWAVKHTMRNVADTG